MLIYIGNNELQISKRLRYSTRTKSVDGLTGKIEDPIYGLMLIVLHYGLILLTIGITRQRLMGVCHIEPQQYLWDGLWDTW
jgi:hypothetical protein